MINWEREDESSNGRSGLEVCTYFTWLVGRLVGSYWSMNKGKVMQKVCERWSTDNMSLPAEWQGSSARRMRNGIKFEQFSCTQLVFLFVWSTCEESWGKQCPWGEKEDIQIFKFTFLSLPSFHLLPLLMLNCLFKQISLSHQNQHLRKKGKVWEDTFPRGASKHASYSHRYRNVIFLTESSPTFIEDSVFQWNDGFSSIYFFQSNNQLR